jgi:hypothetical protein
MSCVKVKLKVEGLAHVNSRRLDLVIPHASGLVWSGVV